MIFKGKVIINMSKLMKFYRNKNHSVDFDEIFGNSQSALSQQKTIKHSSRSSPSPHSISFLAMKNRLK